MIQYKKHALWFLFFCASLTTDAFCIFNDTGTAHIPLRIDNENIVWYNSEFPYRSLNLFSIVWGNPFHHFSDTPERVTVPYKNQYNSRNSSDSLHHISVTGVLGSETGDPLLNKFDVMPKIVNKDHYSTFVGSCTFPYNHLTLFGAYRYDDVFSDKFNRYNELFREKTGITKAYIKSPLFNSVYAGYALSGPMISGSMAVSRYKQWGYAPYFFSTVHRRGYMVTPGVSYGKNRNTVTVDYAFNYSDEYLHPTTPRKSKENDLSVTWNTPFGQRSDSRIGLDYRSRYSPTSSVFFTFSDTLSSLLIWSSHNTLYGNMRFSSIFNVDYTKIPHFIFTLNPGMVFWPQEKAYTFQELNTPVEYIPRQYNQLFFRCALGYSNTLLFPFSAKLWLDCTDRYLLETINTLPAMVRINQEIIDTTTTVLIGGKGTYTLSYKEFSLTFRGNITMNPQGKHISIFMPRFFAMDFLWGHAEGDSPHMALSLENRARVIRTYFNSTQKRFEEIHSPAQTFVSFEGRIPFLSPFFRSHFHPSFLFKASPIRFWKLQAVPEYPFGNETCLTIYVGLQSQLN